MSRHNIPGAHPSRVQIVAALAGDVTANVGVASQTFGIEGKAKLARATFTPLAAFNGADTNSRNLNVKKIDGTVLATLTLNAAAGAKAAGVPIVFTLAAGAAAAIAEGAAVFIESQQVGTGMALPAGEVILEWQGA